MSNAGDAFALAAAFFRRLEVDLELDFDVLGHRGQDVRERVDEHCADQVVVGGGAKGSCCGCDRGVVAGGDTAADPSTLSETSCRYCVVLEPMGSGVVLSRDVELTANRTTVLCSCDIGGH